MRSSSGQYFPALDHIRALAAFMVFCWHFLAWRTGYPSKSSVMRLLLFPAALLDEGHIGVALFMTLSGYLFAKLLENRRVAFGAFLWNRLLRLLPLLLVMITIVGVREWTAGNSMPAYAWSIALGWVLPTLPKGAWSITVEFHFYLMLPLLLWMARKSRWLPLLIVACALLLRTAVYLHHGDVESLAYWTIVGRIDQFVLGMLAFRCRNAIAHRNVVAIVILTVFSAFYWIIDFGGGAFLAPPPLWIVLPTIEAFAFAVGIAWYDNSFKHSPSRLSRVLVRLGEYSYSIYLLHVLIVFKEAAFIDAYVMRLSNFYVACGWSVLCFLAMVIFSVGYFSYRFIESPFLRLRKPYLFSRHHRQSKARRPLPVIIERCRRCTLVLP